MGLKRKLQSHAATDAYRESWERMFGHEGKLVVDECPAYCPLGEGCLNNNYEVGSSQRCDGCKK